MTGELILEPSWIGNNGKCKLSVKLGGEVIGLDKVDTSDARDRRRFISDLVRDRPGFNGDEIESLLLKLAADRMKVCDAAGGAGDADDKSVADLLIELSEVVELFSDDQTAFGSVPVDKHIETIPIKSKAFRLWLRKRLHDEHQRTAYGEALQIAIENIESKAIFNGKTSKVFVRLAGDDDAIYLDLGDPGWRVVRIGADGWEIIDGTSPVRFIRPRGMLPLPAPVRGGDINDLRRFLNVSDDDFILLVGWMLASLRPRGPYPVLAIYGEQGASKSSCCRMLRALIDPNVSPLRAEPREIRDLAIHANNSWVCGFDNLSHIHPWLSDSLCRLSTGGGFSTRELCTDKDEILFSAQRPVILNGIADVVTRPDLLDRSIAITLPAIPEDGRRTEAELWTDFERIRPGILGVLLDAVGVGLANLSSTRIERLPRMADLALWVTACETGIPLDSGSFLAAYRQNREGVNQTAIESSLIGPLLLRFIDGRYSGQWSGTVSELLIELEKLVDDRAKNRDDWPRRPRGLSNALRRIEPNLRSMGIEIRHVGHNEAGNTIEIVRSDERPAEHTELPERTDKSNVQVQSIIRQ